MIIILISWLSINIAILITIIIAGEITKMFKTYYIEYWDKYQNNKTCFLKAKNQEKAEQKFYKQQPYSLIKKIALN